MLRTTTLLRIAALFALLSVSHIAYSQARIDRYVMTTFTSPFANSTSIGPTLVSGDDAAATIALPFAFNFDSVQYSAGTRLYVCTNGWMIFGDSSAPANASTDEVGQPGFGPGVLYFSQHLRNFGPVSTLVTGTAPNRVFTIQNYKFGLQNPNTNATTVRILLYETTNVIEILFLDHSLVLGTGNAGVGLNSGPSPSFESVRFGTAGNTTPATDVRFAPPTAAVQTGKRFVISPSVLNFDSVKLGDTVCMTALIKNIGTDTVHILKNYRSGTSDNDFSFTPVSSADTAIAPNAVIPFSVCFAPVQRGTRIAEYRFDTDIPLTNESPARDTSKILFTVVGVGVPAPRLVVTPNRNDSVLVGTQLCVSDTIFNTGQSDFTILSMKTVGADSADFAISGWTLPIFLLPGQHLVLNYCITPAKHGPRSATLVLNGSTEGRNLTENVALRGYGTQQCASVAPDSLFSVPTPVFTSDTAHVVVSNCGEVSTTYTVSIVASSSGYSILGSATSAAVPSGGAATFAVVFSPKAIGAATDTLVISGTQGMTSLNLPLNGLGTGARITATDSTVQCHQKDSALLTVRLVNTGNIAWNAGNGAITGGSNPADFEVVGLPTPATVPPNGGVALQTILFRPTVTGTETAVLSYPSSAPQPIVSVGDTLRDLGLSAQSVRLQPAQDGFQLLQNYPNPAQDFTDLNFIAPHRVRLELTILDATGRIVSRAPSRYFDAGRNSLRVDCTALPTGTYIYVLSNGTIRLSQAMVKVK